MKKDKILPAAIEDMATFQIESWFMYSTSDADGFSRLCKVRRSES